MADKIGSNRVVKLGIVVNNIEDVAKRYNELFDLAEPAVVNYPDPNKVRPDGAYIKFHDQATNPKLKWCKVNLDPVYLEVIEPADDQPSFWADYLAKHGPGVAFISFYIDGFEHQVDFMEKGGYPLTFVEEKTFERYGYFDTLDKLGVTIELKDREPLK